MILTFAVLTVPPTHTYTHTEATMLIILIHPLTHNGFFPLFLLAKVCVIRNLDR